MNMRTHTAFIFGFGYSASWLWDELDERSWTTFATARTVQVFSDLHEIGIHPVDLQFNRIGIVHSDEAVQLVITAPPSGSGCPGYAAITDSKIEIASVTYLSTTGVYGDRRGNWVDEKSDITPESQRAHNRVLAESQWRSYCLERGLPFRTARLPGIYGPDRSAFERLEKGTARRIIKPGQLFSRIHVEDLAKGLMALLEQPKLAGVFHFCDDMPAPPQDVIEFAAELMGVPVPPDVPIESADLSPMARSFYAECKRVSSNQTRERLGWAPKYPTYREGLTAIWEQYQRSKKSRR